MVISFGGDGTFFKAEALFPGVPKVYLKYSYIGKLAVKKSNEAILAHLVSGEYTMKHVTKLEAKYQDKKLSALGDILIHNKNPRTAIRVLVEVDGIPLQEGEVIGDGLLVATAIGSTGYYKSITRSYFESDDQIGLAFNNAIDQINHVVLHGTRTITVQVTRGTAQVFADNQDECFELETGDVLTIHKASHKASVVEFPKG
jgi:NAD kinase